MAFTSCGIEFFRAVSVGSLDDLHGILGKIEKKLMSNLAQSSNEMGETPLLVAISKRHLHVVQFLVDVLEIDISRGGRFSWRGLDYLNIPPLFAAIISDQMSIIKFLIETKKVSVNLDLFRSDSTTLLHKINVLDLIGAAYILHGDRESRLCGWSYWKESETLGRVTVDEATEEQISKDQLVIQQALNVSQRILKQMRLFPNIYILSSYSKHSWTFVPNVSMYVLKQLNVWWENSSSYVSAEAWNFNKEALNRCLSSIRHQQKRTADSTLLFPNFVSVFSFASERLIRIHAMYWPANQKDRADTLCETTKIVCNISVSIMRMLPRVSSQDSERFKQGLARYIRLYEEWETDKPNLFHRACSLLYVIEQKEPNYQQVIRLFLDAGANPNAIDVDGNIPLHCLLPKNDFEYWLTNPWDSPNENDIPVIRSNFIASVRVLLDAGSHVDLSNRRGETVLELLKRNRKKQKSFRAPFDSQLESVINGVLPLTCYCAQSIKKNNIPVGKLAPTLQRLV